MDTVLNLGMNDAVCQGLATQSQNPRFAWDSYRRFLEMFGNVVLEIPRYVTASNTRCITCRHGMAWHDCAGDNDPSTLANTFSA